MKSCCANCNKWLALEKLDYSNGGCKHSDVGHVCTLFAKEGKVCWMVGIKPKSDMCEGWEPKQENDD